MKSIVDLKTCVVCGNPDLEQVIALPDFPLTGIFLDSRPADLPRGYDQSLMACGRCGHAQLATALPPAELYGGAYANRSSVSHLSHAASDWFVSYIDAIAPGRVFNCILEIGCNDLVLLKKLASKGKARFGIDPIWIDNQPEPTEGLTVIGGFVEDVDFSAFGESKPDLIVSTHNLEHIADPTGLISRLLEIAADDALIVMEVPDMMCLVRHRRFDQVFHQHLHYFTLDSFVRMIERAGGHYHGHAFNQRNWGGSVSICVGKAPPAHSVETPQTDGLTPSAIRTAYRGYRDHMADFMAMIEASAYPMVGYGAGQMVPAVAYHLQSDLSFLECIYDDSADRDGLMYPHLAPVIKTPNAGLSLADKAVLITALDGVRPIMNRLRDANPLFVYTPVNAC